MQLYKLIVYRAGGATGREAKEWCRFTRNKTKKYIITWRTGQL